MPNLVENVKRCMHEHGELGAEVERWRKEAKAVVDTYYVASGKMVIDGQDGYDPIRALRVHLEETP